MHRQRILMLLKYPLLARNSLQLSRCNALDAQLSPQIIQLGPYRCDISLKISFAAA
ncbi:hypothetical protein D3C80_1956060 [compost metagenome]